MIRRILAELMGRPRHHRITFLCDHPALWVSGRGLGCTCKAVR